MPTFAEARKLICDSVTPLGVERVSIIDAVGRVIAEDITAPWDMPLCDNSAMDGYAVRAADCTAGAISLKVIGYIPAGGEVCCVVLAGCAIRIMTGAPVPPGCDAVVPVEETDGGIDTVVIHEPVRLRQHIRFAGEDVAAGETIITKGTLLRAPEVSMLASFGKALVPVYRRARVAILSTGDELVELGESPVAGKIINSNILSLAAAIKEIGAEPLLLGIARDTRESHLEKMTEGLQADAFITSAGVSAGDRDLVREVLAELGAKQLFWKVDIKPGGPTAFAMYENKPVFSLPGNPVSTMITFEAFARPALLKMMGHLKVVRPLLSATLMNDYRKKPGKLVFLRVRIEVVVGRLQAFTSGEQQTGLLKTMLRADAIALIPADCTAVKSGEAVRIYLLREELLMGAPCDSEGENGL